MCIIFVSHAQHSRYRLILAANREEVFSRATAPLHFWEDHKDILAGRDLVASGTWMGLNVVTGRWAGLTNVHDPTKARKMPGQGRSRGEIIERWLNFAPPASKSTTGKHISSTEEFLSDLRRDGEEYEGFNVLFGTLGDAAPPELHFFSNKGSSSSSSTLMSNALYGLSNASLDTPWPKLVYGKEQMEKLIARVPETDTFQSDAEDQLVEGLLDMLRDDGELSLAEETGAYGTGPRCLFYYLDSIDYGTRASTVILARKDGSVRYVERSFDNSGQETGRKEHEVRLGRM